MRQVLWPKYLLGGMLGRGGGIGGAERGEGNSLAGGVESLRGIVGRWPDADAVLQGGMSEGLRDWDLWYATIAPAKVLACNAMESVTDMPLQGPSPLQPPALLPPLPQRKRRAALPRLQRRLRHHLDRRSSRHTADQTPRRPHVSLHSTSNTPLGLDTNTHSQLLLPIRLHHRLHALPTRHRLPPQRFARLLGYTHTRLQRSRPVVTGCGRQYSRRQRRGERESGTSGLPTVRFLSGAGLSMLHFLANPRSATAWGACYDTCSTISRSKYFFIKCKCQGSTMLPQLATRDDTVKYSEYLYFRIRRHSWITFQETSAVPPDTLPHSS